MSQGKALIVQSADSSASDSKLYVLVESDRDQQGTALLVHRRVSAA